jgi:hypothetical protein
MGSAGTAFSVANDEVGIRDLVRQLVPTDFVILEATGGLETPVASALAAAGIAVAIVNPRQVRDFARATGRLAKTDRLDAEVLARFGEAVRPEARPLADEQAQALEALVTRRRQLVEMLTAEKNRRARAPKVLHRSIDEHIRWLEKRLSGFDDELGQLIRNTPVPTENSESLEKPSDLSCPAVESRACSHSSWRFFHGSLVGFAAARNWSLRSLRSATNWQSCVANVPAAPGSPRSIAYSGSGSTGSGRGA